MTFFPRAPRTWQSLARCLGGRVRHIRFYGRWFQENVLIQRSWFDSGYTPMRQSAVPLCGITHIFHLSVDFGRRLRNMSP